MAAKLAIQAKARQAEGNINRFLVGECNVLLFPSTMAVLLSAPCMASTTRFFLSEQCREFLKITTMTRIRGRVIRVERLPTNSSSGERRTGPSNSNMVVLVTEVLRGTVSYHMAFVSIHRNIEAKQEATRWHLG